MPSAGNNSSGLPDWNHPTSYADLISHESANEYDISNLKFTAPKDGFVFAYYSDNETSRRYASLNINGSSLPFVLSRSGNDIKIGGGCMVPIKKGDNVQLIVQSAETNSICTTWPGSGKLMSQGGFLIFRFYPSL